MAIDLGACIVRYERELLGSVIPFWERHSPDREWGGFLTFLDRDGSVYDTEKFMWMQWRAVYMFATLAASEVGQPRWLDLARQGFDFLAAHGKDAQGQYYFALDRRGVPTSAAHNIYSECFAAMGAAALFKATGEEKYRGEAATAMASYHARIHDPKGRWDKAMPGKPRRQGLGHQMMLVNLGQVLAEDLGEPAYADAATAAAGLVLDKFWSPEHGVLFENINADGSLDLGSCEGRRINPGHGLEALWFILDLAAKSGRQQVIPRAAAMIKRQLDFGWDKELGGLYYLKDVLGKPLAELEWNMKLWWVHNEALLAALYAWNLTRDPEFEAWFEKLDAWTWAHFPDQEWGEWYGYLNRDGSPSHALKGGRWKGFFHLPRCLLLSLRQMKALQARP